MDLSCESQEEVNRFGYAARTPIFLHWDGMDNNLSKSDPGTDFCQGNVRPQAGLLNPDPSSPRPRKVLEPRVFSVIYGYYMTNLGTDCREVFVEAHGGQ